LGDGGENGNGGAWNDKESTNHHVENHSLSKLERQHLCIKKSSQGWSRKMAVRAQRNQQSSQGQESSSSSLYSSSSESDSISDDDDIKKRRQKLG